MSNLRRIGGAVLVLGWLLSLLFLFYSEGIFDLSHQWSFSDIALLILALVLAAPYSLAGLFYWEFKRFGLLFLIGLVVMIIASIGEYYSAFFPQPDPDAGWIFLLVPAGQLIFVGVFSALVSMLEKRS